MWAKNDERLDENEMGNGQARTHRLASNTRQIITAGYLLIALLLFPLGMMDLKENMVVQNASFVALLVLSIQIIFAFSTEWGGLRARPAVGASVSNLLGMVIFNYGFCVCVPAWLGEKAPGVATSANVWASIMLSTLLYLLVGFVGAAGLPGAAPENMLSLLFSPSAGRLTHYCAALFGFAIGAGGRVARR